MFIAKAMGFGRLCHCTLISSNLATTPFGSLPRSAGHSSTEVINSYRGGGKFGSGPYGVFELRMQGENMERKKKIADLMVLVESSNFLII